MSVIIYDIFVAVENDLRLAQASPNFLLYLATAFVVANRAELITAKEATPPTPKIPTAPPTTKPS